MAINETGHHINVSRFADLIAFVTNLGSTYKPGKSDITLTELNALHSRATDSLTNVNDSFSTWQASVNARELAFTSLGKLVTRVVSALSVSDADSLITNDAKTVAQKLQGRRAKKKKTDNPDTFENESENSISASQMSFDSRIENLDKLVSLLSAEPNYKPNETDLQTGTLENLLSDLRAKNEAVINAFVPPSSKRIERNETLYNETNGLVKTAGDVKRYVKSVFGANSPQFKQINAIRFTQRKT